MASCILTFYLVAAAGVVLAQSTSAADPDALFRDRENMADAERATAIWTAASAGGHNFEASWKLARAEYWLGTRGAEADRRTALQRGVDAGETAATLSPDKPEGHFWLAANMGALAESFGIMQGLKYRGRIKSELERVLAIDPAWQEGSASRGLGWWYHRVPGLFGGSNAKAETYLRDALKYAPESTATLYFLGEVLWDRGKKDEARATWQHVVNAPFDPEWTPEDRDFKQKAAAELRQH